MSPLEKPASYGTTGADPLVLGVSASQLSIFFEWVALLPLVIYLAGPGLPYRLVGQAALAKRVVVSFFPRLGILGSISAFLSQSSDFIDRASSVSKLRRTVWDTNWGGAFPCANGAASDILTRYASPSAKEIVIPDDLSTLTSYYIPDHVRVQRKDVSAATKGTKETFRRYQTLYIIDCGIDSDKLKDNIAHSSQHSRAPLIEAIILTSIVGVCVVVILLGLYGTAVALLLGAVFRVTRLLIKVVCRPAYLENSEHSRKQGCMLVAIHENASTWYLYRGCREVVDGLLNKPMILDITAHHMLALITTLRSLAILQLLIMTYVAAQKGWDGIGLLAVLAVAWSLDYLLYNDNQLAKSWLARHSVRMQA